MKWLTPRAYRRWRDTGLLGYGADNLPDPGWRGRNDARNAAYADLLVTSGLREREGGTLLVHELPVVDEPRSYYRSRLATQPGKSGGRDYWIRADAMNRIMAYLATSRRAAITEAHARKAYDDIPGRLIVIAVGCNGVVTARREDDTPVKIPLNTMSLHERTLLFTEGDHGVEPLHLWLTESGMPMDFTTWNSVFLRAERPLRVLRAAGLLHAAHAPAQLRAADARRAVARPGSTTGPVTGRAPPLAPRLRRRLDDGA